MEEKKDYDIVDQIFDLINDILKAGTVEFANIMAFHSTEERSHFLFHGNDELLLRYANAMVRFAPESAEKFMCCLAEELEKMELKK